MSNRNYQKRRAPVRYQPVRYVRAAPVERVKTVVVKPTVRTTRNVSKAESKKNYKISKQIAGAGAELGGYAGQALGALAGGAIGGPMGSAIGSALGGVAGYGLSKIMGFGEYKVERNIFMEGRLPQMMNMPTGGGTVIRFQEYLSDIYTTADISNPSQFDIQSFLINPANSRTFPWLSQVAANYEQYFIEGLVFEFRSTSADALNSTNTALGSVMMATQYDVADAVFRSKAEMLNYEYSNSLKPSDNCLHMVECEPSQSVLAGLYTLEGAAPAGTDSRLYHLGRFSIATVGFQAANVNIGELHVTYQIRLLKPKLFSELGLANDWALLTATGASAYTNASPLGGPLVVDGRSNIGVTASGGTVTLPTSSVIKTYRIEVFWIGSVAVASVGSITTALTVANCVVNSSGQAPDGAAATLAQSCYFAISTLGNSRTASFSFGPINLPGNPSQCIVRIMQVPQDSFS